MDLNISSLFFHGNGEIIKSGDSQSNHGAFPSQVLDDGCKLVLGLGPTPSSFSDNYFPVWVNKGKQSVTIFGKGLSPEGGSGILKLGLSSANENVMGSHESSASNSLNQTNESGFSIPIVEEGSTSAKKSGVYMPSLLMAPGLQHPNFSPKPCKFEGCSKGARGASGLCIVHGGGQRCHKPGCNNGAESRTAYCKAHGGGKRCLQLGCTKSAEGKTDYCIAHGGGKRCGHSGCTKASRGKSGLCIRHGGGKRCKVEECTRSAEGQAGLCISHGGGRRCQAPECTKGAQGSTLYCKAHGGGKRCIFSGCTKGAEGSTPLCKGHGGGKRCLFEGGGICSKSVHGGTNYCVAHGGGKRCTIWGCTKSARGRTDCCVRHGGGKRCQFENCGKSAQGSTDLCKAHGGGKRCTWEHGKCEKFARGKNGLCAAHGSLVQEWETEKGGMIGPGLFRGLVSGSTMGSSMETEYSSSVSVISDCIDSATKPNKRQKMIPPQVLVPLSMKLPSFSGHLGSEREEEGSKGVGGKKSFDFMVPEGRVHGGLLMSLLGGNLKEQR